MGAIAPWVSGGLAPGRGSGEAFGPPQGSREVRLLKVLHGMHPCIPIVATPKVPELFDVRSEVVARPEFFQLKTQRSLA